MIEYYKDTAEVRGILLEKIPNGEGKFLDMEYTKTLLKIGEVGNRERVWVTEEVWKAYEKITGFIQQSHMLLLSEQMPGLRQGQNAVWVQNVMLMEWLMEGWSREEKKRLDEIYQSKSGKLAVSGAMGKILLSRLRDAIGRSTDSNHKAVALTEIDMKMLEIEQNQVRNEDELIDLEKPRGNR